MGGILIVEDDADIREYIASILTDEGYAVLQASDGQDALAQLRALSEPPCLILLDLMMPGMSGWDFRSAQLGEPALAAIPVVILSAVEDVRRNAAALQAVGYIIKPIDIALLLNAIERHC